MRERESVLVEDHFLDGGFPGPSQTHEEDSRPFPRGGRAARGVAERYIYIERDGVRVSRMVREAVRV